MGLLGSKLEDYWSYQLLDEVIRQLKEGDAGDFDKLRDRLMELNIITTDMILSTVKTEKEKDEKI